MPDLFENFEWRSLLFGTEKWTFLVETVIRTIVMFLVIVFSLRFLGKRGIKQLSVFELGVIIGLGSAAGDPMFYKDVGLLAGIFVFVTVMALYRLITFLINRSNRFEQFVEGTPTCIVENGRFLVSNFKKEPVALDELFSQLRIKSISHLGQIRQAIIETNGEVSVFYFPDEEVAYGLPIIPEQRKGISEIIKEEGHYSCTHCGNTEMLNPTPQHDCTACGKKEWVPAINEKRIK